MSALTMYEPLQMHSGDEALQSPTLASHCNWCVALVVRVIWEEEESNGPMVAETIGIAWIQVGPESPRREQGYWVLGSDI